MISSTNLMTKRTTDIINTSTKPKAWVRPRTINQNIYRYDYRNPREDLF